jgi:glutamate racemase
MIAMFDSGLGGLSIWRALAGALPDWPISYLADQAYCPYGSRSHAQITQRSLCIGRWLADQGADMLVVACNTATSVAVETLRRELRIPVVGVEPAVKPAAAACQTGQIAVLATEAMLNSARFRSLLQRHAGNVQVISRPGRGWVEQVESGELDSPQARAVVRAVVEPLLEYDIDHIVLGCTHYPFLAPLIRSLAGEAICLVDPAEAIARRVVKLLDNRSPPPSAHYRFFTTSDDPRDMSMRLPALIGHDWPVKSIILETAESGV